MNFVPYEEIPIPGPDESPVSDESAEATPVAETTLVYVGPPLRNPLPLRNGTVFKGGLPVILQKAVQESPELAASFLPFSQARSKLNSGR